ncbi:MAG TPA: cysteine hydrolase [Thermomicrobiales bacterium]|nr:cysteine hydrolase [Thermomicrobiales bacterium]
MKRRTFLARLAGTPLLGATGYLASSEAFLSNHTASVALQTPATANATTHAMVDPRHSALLVLDYQPAWIKTLTDSDALLSRAADAIAMSREVGMEVAYARVAFTPADYAAVPEHNIIFSQLASRPGALDDDSPETAVDDRVAPEPGDKVVRKTRVGAFARTDLDEWLRDLEIDTLILAGISTSGVVLSTVYDGADRDYRLVVLSDACADQDPEIQDLLIHKVFPQRAEVITVGELSGLFPPAS